MPEHIKDVLEERARRGDGPSAIAFAILELTDQHRKLATALDYLGLNMQSGTDTIGAVEMIAIQLKDWNGMKTNG